LYTEGIEYAAGNLLDVSRIHARQVEKSFFYFNYSVWMNIFCYSVCCMLHICVQLSRQSC